MGVVLAEGHRALPDEPGAELLVRANETVRSDREENRPQPVEDLVGPLGLGSDLRVQADEGVAKCALHQHGVEFPIEIPAWNEMPAEIVPR